VHPGFPGRPGASAVIFLIDASVYVFRAYHSVLPDMVDRDGNPVPAVFGFARFIGDLSISASPIPIAAGSIHPTRRIASRSRWI